VASTVDELARLRSISASELADIVAANLKRLVAT
jgi:Tat protein secretion system quality control protein TatD with DNase activity